MITKFLLQLRSLCLTLCGLRPRFRLASLDRKLFEAARVFGNEFHSIFGDLYSVLVSEPGKPGNVEPWLTRNHHSGRHDRLVSPVQRVRFVATDSNSVTYLVAM